MPGTVRTEAADVLCAPASPGTTVDGVAVTTLAPP